MTDNQKHIVNIFTKLSYYITAIATVSIAYSIINIQQKQLGETSEAKIENYAKQEEYQKSRLNLLNKVPNFGFDNLVADFTFLNFAQYFGDYEARNDLGYSLVPDYFKTIVKQDPRFVSAYLHLAPASTMFAGQPQKTVAIMSEGLKSLNPQIDKSYLVWTYKGVDELLFLGEKVAAQNSYATGAKWASYHSDERSKVISNRAKETAEFLASNPDSTKAQASSWMMLFTNAKDRQVRQMALQQIKYLGGEVIINGNKITVKMPDDNKG